MKPMARLVAFASIALAAGIARAGDWAQWRGPEQDGVSREKNLPDHWSPEGDNVVWSNDCGGMSSPIVMKGKVYSFTRTGEVPAGVGATATVDPGPLIKETFRCMDAKDGHNLWEHHENMTMTDVPFHRLGWSNPVGDPSTGRVYALGSQCMFYCFNGETGEVIWKRQMTEEFGMISTFGGRTPSPAVDEEQVYIAGVSFGWGNNAGGQHRIYAFNKNTGELNWTTGTGGIPVDAPYNTPVITVINGEKLAIFAAGDGGIHAFQARTGKKVWSFKGSKHGMNSSVIVHGDKVFATWDLDNYDSTKLGRVVCLDAANIVNGAPKEVWRQDGVEAGFPSATLYDGTLYVPTDNAIIYALDEKTGKIKYKHGFGTIGKASLVFADGKLYFPEANGLMRILKPGEKKFEELSYVEVTQKPGREYAIFGSVAVSDGHIFLETANKMYCIGAKDPKVESDPIPQAAYEEPLEKSDIFNPTFLQVVPADVVLHPGEKVELKCLAYDAKGRLISVFEPKWSVGQLLMPPPPPRPKELMRLNSMSAGTGTPPPETAPPAATAPAATTQPTLIGNLLGDVDATGTYTSAAGPFQGGAVVATFNGIKGETRVRVFPSLPWSIDFKNTPLNKPPLTWIGAGSKFAAHDIDGKRVLTKLTDIPLYARARTYFGTVAMKDYTIAADVKVTETVLNQGGTAVHTIPDVGVIDTRYVLELKGSDQTLGIHSWAGALPRNEVEPGLAIHKTIPFPWEAGKWYREKLMVRREGGKAIITGKVWPVGTDEPKDWTIELEDSQPNESGAPGFWGFSNDHEIYFDNILVSENKQ